MPNKEQRKFKKVIKHRKLIKTNQTKERKERDQKAMDRRLKKKYADVLK